MARCVFVVAAWVNSRVLVHVTVVGCTVLDDYVVGIN